jgi:hypothetical protein
MVRPGMVVHTCNASTWEEEAGVLQVQGQATYIMRPWLKNKNKKRIMVHNFT